ncbi:hypothetical protein BKA70DRAFT_1442888 [Coprinopsis sp. MPI-PUGE-AT-0042]|nr:hypothetical protein BKA70DRAFT_1442888 [Coprinopsis sp. MPI-PUGE-AT-0042]
MRFFLANDLARLFVEGINTQGNESSEPVLPFGDSLEYVLTRQFPRRTWGLQPEGHPIPPSQVGNCSRTHYCDHTDDGVVVTAMYHTTMPSPPLITDRHSQALTRTAKEAA